MGECAEPAWRTDNRVFGTTFRKADRAPWSEDHPIDLLSIQVDLAMREATKPHLGQRTLEEAIALRVQNASHRR